MIHARRAHLASLAALLALAVACGGPPAPPRIDPPSAAGPVIITSPVHGSSVSGAVYFAAQVLDPGVLSTLELRVAGEVVSHQFPGESPLRVFLIPRDHPEGPLQLSASVGNGSQRYETTITVNVVHQPPDAASVGAGGALLGGAEQSGAISTVVIPAGVAQGASVQFETMTQAEVLAATGVDYDALGVTFLGAQEIRSTIPTGDGVQMTSGGFGPMVQPGQAVVSYRIIPDAGRGVGELMVINSAAVAPNGDIVSGRPIEPQAGDAISTSSLGTLRTAAARSTQQNSLPAGPPGTDLDFVVAGLNVYAVHGYQVRFRRGSQIVNVPASVGLGGDGYHYLLSHVPDMPPGAVTVELVAVAGDRVFATYQMTVTASPATPDPKGIIDAALAGMLTVIDETAENLQDEGFTLDLEPLTSAVETARTTWAGRPADDPELRTVARLLAGGGLTANAFGLLSAVLEPSSRPRYTGAACQIRAFKYLFDREAHSRIGKGAIPEAALRTIMARNSLEFMDQFAERAEGTEYECDPLKDELCEEYGIGPGCDQDDDVIYPDEDSPNDWRPRPPPPGPGGPNDWTTGMGSLPPPGGPLGGSAGGGGAGDSGLRAAQASPSQAFMPPFEHGRFAMRVLAGGAPWPFAAQIAEDGYFYLPALPAGQVAQLVVTDRSTFAECFVDITSRSIDSATAIYLDLEACLSEGFDPDEYTIAWVSTAPTGNWNTASNWDPPRVPNEDDDVLIPSLTTQVNILSSSVAVRSLRSNGVLQLSNSTLVAENDIELNWLGLAGDPSTIDAGGVFSYDRLRLGGHYSLPTEVTTLLEVWLGTGGHGTLTFDHDLAITEHLQISSGALRGDGRTIILPDATGEILRVGGAGAAQLYDDHTLEVRGTLQWASPGSTNGAIFHLYGTSTLHVTPSGTLDMGGVHSRLYIGADGHTGYALNEGLVLVRPSPVESIVSVNFENHGTVLVEAGAMLTSVGQSGSYRTRFVNAGTITGEGTFSSERTLSVASQGGEPFVHQADAILDVATLQLATHSSGDNVLVEGPLGVARLQMLNSGRLNLDQDLVLDELLLYPPTGGLTSPTFASSGTTTVNEFLGVGGVTFAGTGTTVLQAAGVLDLTMMQNRTVSEGHVLVNHGTATWGPMASSQLNVQADSEFQNHGQFIVQNDRLLTGAGVFRNFGTIHKTTEGVSTWSVCYIEELGGEVVLDDGAEIDFTGSC